MILRMKIFYLTLIQIKAEFPDVGERLLMGMLHGRGIRCSRDTLRRVIHDTDPIITSLRWNAKIVRRSYSVPIAYGI